MENISGLSLARLTPKGHGFAYAHSLLSGLSFSLSSHLA